MAFTVFPDEIFKAPRSWAEQVYPNLIYWGEVDRGGHFAAWEEPELFATELRAASPSCSPPSSAPRSGPSASPHQTIVFATVTKPRRLT